MTTCEDFRKQLTNVTSKLSGMETTIREADTLRKRLQMNEEIEWGN